MRKNRGRAGFTMAEMLVAVGILIVLLGVAVPSVVSIRANLKMTELDDCARVVFAAAQNRLVALRAAGGLDGLDGTAMAAPPQGFDETGLTWDDNYCYLTRDGAAALLPPGSIDEAVRGGDYVIEFNRATAMVYGVFYAESEITGYPALPRDRAERKKRTPMLGYYGGSGVDRSEIGQCGVPEFIIIDDKEETDQLYVRLTPSASSTYTITVAAKDGAGKAEFQFQDTDQDRVSNKYPGLMSYVTGDGPAYYKLVLDGLGGGEQFQILFAGSGISPGVDLRVTVSVSNTEKPEWLSANDVKYANSLFDSRTGGSVKIANRRHLQNLHTGFSGVEEGVTAAVQSRAIAWDRATLGSFQPIDNPSLESFNGGGNVLSGLYINSAEKNLGLFAAFDGGTVSGVRLENIDITGQTPGAAGGLIGYARNTAVADCRVYAAAPFSDCRLAAQGLAGGLIGLAENCTIEGSSASVPSVSASGAGSAAGGLVGLLEGGGSISKCYADSGWLDGDGAWRGGVSSEGSSGGLAGVATGGTRVENCYALGQVGGPYAAGLLTGGDGVGVNSCYSAVQFTPGSGSTYGLTTGGAPGASFYWDGSKPDQTFPGSAADYEGLTKYFSLDGGVWVRCAEGATRPYGGSGAYPFPGLSGMTHYGDWPAKPEEAGDVKGVVYYEQYGDGSYGLAGVKDGQYIDMLKGNDYTIALGSYGILVGKGDPSPAGYYYVADGMELSNLFGDPVALEGVGDLYPFTEETLSILGGKTNQGRYVALQQKRGGYWETLVETYYLNPRFANTVVSAEDVGKLGTTDHPFELRTQEQLSNLRHQAGNNSWWLQTHDIPVKNWTSVTPTTWEGSVIDGGGNRITGLDQPLFSVVNNVVTLRNIRIEQANITLNGGGSFGILANTSSGILENCAVTNSSINASNGSAAGLVGVSAGGAIQSCHVDHVTIGASGEIAAGLVCESSKPIQDCAVTNSSINASNGSAAGLVGVSTGGAIQSCRVDSVIIGASGEMAAGLVCKSSIQIQNCYAANSTVTNSNVDAPNGSAAGLVGYNENGAIRGCHVDNVTIGASGKMAAGLVCESRDSQIQNCYAANSNVDAPNGSAAGLVVTKTGGSIQSSYANNDVSGEDAAGFVVSNSGAISDCYALLNVAGTGRAAGFLLDCGWGAVTGNYSALTSITGGQTYGFAPRNGSINNCYYLEQENLNAGAGTSLTYAELSALSLGEGWETATAERSHPASASLAGRAYPFPLISALDHYGDWPAAAMGQMEMAYYEVYEEKDGGYSIAFYNRDLGLDGLRSDLPIIQDGYVLLFREDADKNNHYGDIPFSHLTDSKYLTCRWRNGTAVTTANYLKTVNAFTYNGESISVDYDGRKLTPNDTITFTSGGRRANYLPLFLSARMTVSAGTATDSFYQYLTVRDVDTKQERTFWYAPHFAKSAITADAEPPADAGITASIRTERQFASLATNANRAYWGPQRTYQQERDLDLGGSCRYTTTYFDSDLTAGEAGYRPYRAETDPIGSSGAAFQGVYDGGGHILRNLSYTAADGSGVFGYVKNAHIFELKIEDVSVVSRSGARAGGLAGSVSGADTLLEEIELENVTVTAASLAGGAVGRLSGGTVRNLKVDGAAVSAARLAGGAVGQLVNEAAVSMTDVSVEDARVSTLSSIRAAGGGGDRNITYGTGGFAGALVMNVGSGGAVALDDVSVEETEVTVEEMSGDESLTGHGGAAFVGNLYNDRKDAVLTLRDVELSECTVNAAGAAGESAYGLFFGRIRALCPVALPMDSMEAKECALAWTGTAGGADGAAFGGYIGALDAAAGASGTSKLIVTLPGGRLPGAELKLGNTGAADVGGFLGRLGENTVLQGGNTALKETSVQGGGGSTGGFVGASAGILSDCSVDDAKAVAGAGDTGGFAGSVTRGEIRNCDVRMTGWLRRNGSQGNAVVQGGGTGSAGGFVGALSGREAVVQGCFAAVPVHGKTGSTGGFAGRAASGRLEQCYASGRVDAEGGQTGGFVGYTLQGGDGVIPLLTGCYASGNVMASGEEGDTGGFVGRSDAGTILSAYSVGTVSIKGGARSGRTGGFLGSGQDLTAEQTGESDILAAMATFYNVLQTTKVINRADSFATAEFLPDGTVVYNDDDCKRVTEYLTGSAIQIDSNVAGDESRIKGVWDPVTGELKSGGAVTWNVVQTMRRYPELQNGTWMARREGGDIAVYWCTENLAEYGAGSTIPAYRYVSAEQKYYVGTMLVGTSTEYGQKYYVLKVDPAASWTEHAMPATMTINGFFRYSDSDNAGTGEVGKDPYCDYQYIGITRWTDGEFALEENRAKAFPSMGTALENMLYYKELKEYPYPALAGAGCNTKPYTHWGSWWR